LILVWAVLVVNSECDRDGLKSAKRLYYSAKSFCLAQRIAVVGRSDSQAMLQTSMQSDGLFAFVSAADGQNQQKRNQTHPQSKW